ncbi:MAG TPA: NAD(P)-binding domain-containing protein [Candidatus Caccocola faecipullorum]|nr:NAD(P)-binding domain-containing protein [Candidatus Caccocola faecipullorum]
MTNFADCAEYTDGLLDGKTIGIAGFGHLGSSIAEALVANGFPRERLLISCGGSAATLERAGRMGLASCMTDTRTLASRADFLLLAARPQDLASFSGLRLKEGAFVMSFMAGISLETLHRVFSSELCRVMCSGPETITDGMGVSATFPSEARPHAVLRAAGLEVFDLSCENELDAFTVAICLPPILLNIDLESEKSEVLAAMAERYPVCRGLVPWMGRVVEAHRAEKSESSLENVSTKGGVTEAMTTALRDGSTLAGSIAAGLERCAEISAELAKRFATHAA